MCVLSFNDGMGVGGGIHIISKHFIFSRFFFFTIKNLKKDSVFQMILLQHMGLGQWLSGSLFSKVVFSFLGVFSSFYRFFFSYSFFSVFLWFSFSCFFVCSFFFFFLHIFFLTAFFFCRFFLVFFFLLFFFNCCFLKRHWCLLWFS